MCHLSQWLWSLLVVSAQELPCIKPYTHNPFGVMHNHMHIYPTFLRGFGGTNWFSLINQSPLWSVQIIPTINSTCIISFLCFYSNWPLSSLWDKVHSWTMSSLSAGNEHGAFLKGFMAQLCHGLRVPEELSRVISQWHEANWNPNRCLRSVRQVSAQARHEEAVGRRLSFIVIQTTVWLRLIFTFSTTCIYFGSQSAFFIYHSLFKYQGVRNPNEIALSKNWHWLAL